MKTEKSPKKCKVCDELLTGRSDKKYCSEQCKTIYNNKNGPRNSKVVKSTNNKLLRLYCALIKILNDELSIEVAKYQLRHLSNNMTVMTHIVNDKQSNFIGIGIYDLILIELKNGNIKIERSNDTT